MAEETLKELKFRKRKITKDIQNIRSNFSVTYSPSVFLSNIGSSKASVRDEYYSSQEKLRVDELNKQLDEIKTQIKNLKNEGRCFGFCK